MMTRWDRRGLAAPTGFREVKGGSGLEAQVIDRGERKCLSAFPGWPVGLLLRSLATFRGVVDRRGFIGRGRPEKQNWKPKCRAALDFYSRKTQFNLITPEAFQGKIERGNDRAEGKT